MVSRGSSTIFASEDKTSNQPFVNRREAGAELATKLKRYAGRDDIVLLALPRGGVPVAFEVAEALDAALDIFLVRKLGMPGYREFAMGAIASGGVRVLSEDVIRAYRTIGNVGRVAPGELRDSNAHARKNDSA